MICTFFGHRDSPEHIRQRLSESIQKLIEEEGVSTFYVGNQGNFDRMVLSTLRALVKVYPTIRYYVVVPYLNTTQSGLEDVSIFPECLESVMPKFAIDKRNRWMPDRADFVISYVCHKVGGAAFYQDLAIKRGKNVLNLAWENR